MSELKTKPNDESVETFLAGLDDPQRRAECQTLAEIMQRVTGAEPKMWGTGMVGFGQYHYVYDSGRSGDWFRAGFSPRKQNLTLYILCGLDKYPDLMQRLGKYKSAKSCLYVKRLADIDLTVLEALIRESDRELERLWPSR